MSTKRLPMILPAAEPASGEIPRRLFLRDIRVPRPFDFDRPPRLIGSWDRNESCPDGRHLWDAIAAEGECRLDDDERERVEFRLTLTCVRCGHVEHLAGVTHEEHRRSAGRVPVEPLAAGGLRAQQVTEDGRGLISEWHVFDQDGQRAGFMSTGVTRRGREFVQGRLDAGQLVEAPTATACLRKLAKTSGDAG